MPFLNNIEQLRSIEWGKKYLWDVKFQDAPAPFNSFFPAIDVDESVASLDSHDVSSPLSTHKFPKSSRHKDIRLTFYDDEKLTLFNWIKNWMNVTILNNGQYISTLETSIKLLQIIKFNSKREEVLTSEYWVYPDSDLIFNGSSASDAQQYSIPFIIVGISGNALGAL